MHTNLVLPSSGALQPLRERDQSLKSPSPDTLALLDLKKRWTTPALLMSPNNYIVDAVALMMRPSSSPDRERESAYVPAYSQIEHWRMIRHQYNSPHG